MSAFISWAGLNTLSHRFAVTLREWITGLFTENLECFVSTNDIAAGTTWLDKLFRAIDQSEAGIVIVTRESIRSEWLLFEAGALARKVGWDSQRLCPLLLDLHPSALNDPLASFQYKTMPLADEASSKEAMKDVVAMLHDIISSELQFNEVLLARQFDVWWPALWQDYARISRETSATPALAPVITPNEIYIEVRNAVRQITESIAEMQRAQIKPSLVNCPHCQVQQPLTSAMRAGDTRNQVCINCGQVFNIHANQSGVAFTRPIPKYNTPPGPPVSLIEVEPLCWHCEQQFKISIPDRPGATIVGTCTHCGQSLNVHLDSQKRVFTRPLPAPWPPSSSVPTSLIEVEPECWNCHQLFKVQIPDRPGATLTAKCANCGQTVNVHTDGQMRVFTRAPGPPISAPVSYPSRVEMLRDTECWVEIGIREQLVDLLIRVAKPIDGKNPHATVTDVKNAMALTSQEQGNFIGKNLIHRFVKLLMIGGAFEFDGVPTFSAYKTEFINVLDQARIVSALFRGYVRRLRNGFPIGLGDMDSLSEELQASRLPGGVEALKAALQEVPSERE